MVFQESFKQKSFWPFLWNLTQDLLSLGSKSSKNFILRRWPHVAPKRPLVQGQFFFCSTLGRIFSELWEIFPHPVFCVSGWNYSRSFFFEERPSLRWLMRNTQDGPFEEAEMLVSHVSHVLRTPMFPQNQGEVHGPQLAGTRFWNHPQRTDLETIGSRPVPSIFRCNVMLWASGATTPSFYVNIRPNFCWVRFQKKRKKKKRSLCYIFVLKKKLHLGLTFYGRWVQGFGRSPHLQTSCGTAFAGVSQLQRLGCVAILWAIPWNGSHGTKGIFTDP